MRPQLGEVLHFSEDPAIRRFVPRVAPSSHHAGEYVWAVDESRAPDFWFPRQCPRAMAWTTDANEDAGIQLRVLPNLWPFWDAIIRSTLGFSGIRLRNAARHP